MRPDHMLRPEVVVPGPSSTTFAPERPLPPPPRGGGPAQRSPSRRPTLLGVARWSARHRLVAILAWIAFVALCLVIGGMAGSSTLDDADSGSGPSKTADARLGHADFGELPVERVLVTDPRGPVGPGAAAAADQLRARIAGLPTVTTAEAPVRSPDGRSLMVPVTLRVSTTLPGDRLDNDSKAAVRPVLAATARRRTSPP